ncbi:MAG: hypothetical protein ACRDO1_00665 [Nocardioidaceae bacterium]
MPDRDPIAELSALAREGRDLATPLPAVDVRARGARRHRRRVATTVATACLAVALCAGVAVAAAGNVLGTAPQPIAPTRTPAPTQTPIETAPELTEDQRLTAGDIAWGPEVEWGSIGLTESFESSDTGCYTEVLANLSADRGVAELWHEKFRSAGENPQAEAITMQFGSADAARAVYDLLIEAGDGCEQLVRERGGEPRPDMGDWVRLAVPEGEAQYIEGMYADTLESEVGFFDSMGVVINGDRVVVVGIIVRGQDNNWAYNKEQEADTGLPLHPQIRTLPVAAERLAR